MINSEIRVDIRTFFFFPPSSLLSSSTGVVYSPPYGVTFPPSKELLTGLGTMGLYPLILEPNVMEYGLDISRCRFGIVNGGGKIRGGCMADVPYAELDFESTFGARLRKSAMRCCRRSFSILSSRKVFNLDIRYLSRGLEIL